MKLPERIKLGGLTYTVSLFEPETHSAPCAEVNNTKLTIKLNNSMRRV